MNQSLKNLITILKNQLFSLDLYEFPLEWFRDYANNIDQILSKFKNSP